MSRRKRATAEHPSILFPSSTTSTLCFNLTSPMPKSFKLLPIQYHLYLALLLHLTHAGDRSLITDLPHYNIRRVPFDSTPNPVNNYYPKPIMATATVNCLRHDSQADTCRIFVLHLRHFPTTINRDSQNTQASSGSVMLLLLRTHTGYILYTDLLLSSWLGCYLRTSGTMCNWLLL